MKWHPLASITPPLSLNLFPQRTQQKLPPFTAGTFKELYDMYFLDNQYFVTALSKETDNVGKEIIYQFNSLNGPFNFQLLSC
jgi:hypothetical protein